MTKRSLGRVWRLCGRILYRVAWPGIYIIIRTQPPRTRVVLMHKNHILVIKDWLGSGNWTLPGGGLYQQEQAARGAIRELMEETGIRMRASELHKSGEYFVRSHGIPMTILGYYVEVDERPNIELRKWEVCDHQWITPEKLMRLPHSPTVIQPIRQALQRTGRRVPDLLK